mmetsp:Transcript_17522/g.30067  ORF Transcript_17522/g.30067 Transcript_17522/m.30067 type:complete len:108 (+) Transcript_17522:368-691(+)
MYNTRNDRSIFSMSMTRLHVPYPNNGHINSTTDKYSSHIYTCPQHSPSQNLVVWQNIACHKTCQQYLNATPPADKNSSNFAPFLPTDPCKFATKLNTMKLLLASAQR